MKRRRRRRLLRCLSDVDDDDDDGGGVVDDGFDDELLSCIVLEDANAKIELFFLRKGEKVLVYFHKALKKKHMFFLFTEMLTEIIKFSSFFYTILYLLRLLWSLLSLR